MIALSCVSLAFAVVAVQSPAPVHIDLAVVGPLTPVMSGAIAEASRIWARYGIVVHQAAGDSTPGVLVHVRTAAVAAATGGDVRALGTIAFHDGVPDPDITIYEGHAWDIVCASVGTATAGWPTVYRERVLGRVLGRALAHEVGHFLLQSTAHSHSGLMRANQAPADLMTDDRAGVLLADEDLAALPAAVDRLRRSQPPSPADRE